MYLLRTKEYNTKTCTIPNFISDKEIKKILYKCKEINFQDGKVGVTDNYALDEKTRLTKIKWIELDNDTLWLYEKIRECIIFVNANYYGYTLKYFSTLQFAEYCDTDQGFYCKHNDSGELSSTENFVDIRKLSFSIQLSFDNYSGGDLLFYDGNDEFKASKNRGDIIFFPSNMYHEVTPVVKGIRNSIVGWVYGPNLF